MASQVESIKWLPGTRFMVDGFAFASPRCQHYFLTHFHSDHTIGLRRSFEAGTIFASPVTAALLVHDFGLRPDVVRVLEIGVRAVVEGVGVTPIDANHCPGAVMFLFEVPRGDGGVEVILHTGDCRWQDWIKEQSVLSSIRVDTLFLDTTYCLPRHDFPPQQVAIDAMVQAIREAREQEPATLVVVSSYHIGKERAFLGAARQLGCKVYCSKAKRKVLALLDLPQSDMELLTDEPADAGLHVAAAMGMRHESLVKYITPEGPWKQVVGVRPTGWTFRKSAVTSVWREGATTIIGVPYSEHSSWSDLRACVAAIRPKRIVPTVNARDAVASRAIVDRFAGLMDLSRDRSRLDAWLSAAKPKQVLLPLGPPPLAPGETLALAGDGDAQPPECVDELLGCKDQAAACSGAECCGGSEGTYDALQPCAPVFASNASDPGKPVTTNLEDDGPSLCPGTALPASLPDANVTTAGPQEQPGACQGTATASTPHLDLAAVDLQEQAQIWEQLQRHKRIREAAAQQQASRKLRRCSSSSSSQSSSGTVLGGRASSSSSGGSTQTQQEAAGVADVAAGVGGSSQSSIKAFFGFFGRR